jgi:hypothetical protein
LDVVCCVFCENFWLCYFLVETGFLQNLISGLI